MSIFNVWARRHGVTPQAMAELEALLGIAPEYSSVSHPPRSEAAVQNAVRLEAGRRGDLKLWRNNVGVLLDDRGIPLRFGLANDSHRLNEVVKSGDLIGVWKRLITPEMVGTHIGQFCSFECKSENWKFSPTDKREKAQLNWANVVNTMGGYARFITSEAHLPPVS